MADYTQQTWVDDDGSGAVGTIVTKARMDTIEAGVKDAAEHNKSGLDSAKPAAAAGNKGWVWDSTDTGVTWLSTGSAWIIIGVQGTTYTRDLLTATTSSSALDKLGFTTFTKTLVDDVDASAVLSTLGFSSLMKTLIDDTTQTIALGTLGAAGLALANEFTAAQLISHNSGLTFKATGGGSALGQINPGGGSSFVISSLVAILALTSPSHVNINVPSGNLNVLLAGAANITNAQPQLGQASVIGSDWLVLKDSQASSRGGVRGLTLSGVAEDGIEIWATTLKLNVATLMLSTIAAKGDLLVGTADDTLGKLAASATDGYVLATDSTKTTGLDWKDSGALVRAKETGRYTNSAAGSYATNSKIAINTKVTGDTAADFDTTNNRFQPKRAGWYWIAAQFGVLPAAGPTPTWAMVRVWKNGTASGTLELTHAQHAATSAQEIMPHASGAVYLNGSTDYLEMFILHNSGGNVALEVTPSYTFFSWHFIATDYAGGMAVPRVGVYKTALQNCNNGSWTTLTYDGEDTDPYSAHAAGDSKLYAKASGWHRVYFTGYVTGVTAGSQISLRVVKNGSLYVGGDGHYQGSTGYFFCYWEGLLNAGDYVESGIFINNAGAAVQARDEVNGIMSRFTLKMDADNSAMALVPEANHIVGAAGEPAFQNSWTHYVTNAAQFFKDTDGVVHLEGATKSGTNNVTMFTLPVGYRPPIDRRFGIDGVAGVTGYIYIGSNGDVQAANLNATTICPLDGISFRAA